MKPFLHAIVLAAILLSAAPLHAIQPNFQNCRHDVSNIEFVSGNHGILGHTWRLVPDCETGDIYPGCVFPAGSRFNYLDYITFWFATVVGEDTLCSTGHALARIADMVYEDRRELNPDYPPGGAMQRISNRYNLPYYSDDASSDLDLLAEYTDTVTNSDWVFISQFDGPHKPLGLKISQRTMTWSAGYASDFVLADFTVKNIGNYDLRRIYLGINFSLSASFTDSSGSSTDGGEYCGLIETCPLELDPGIEDTMYLAWGADADGSPGPDGQFNSQSITGVSAVRVLRAPTEDMEPGYNWTVGGGYHPYQKGSWGPMLQSNARRLSLQSEGYPITDEERYYILTNGERDYDSFRIGHWTKFDEYLPVSPLYLDAIRNGYKMHQFLSYGPFDLPPGDSVPLTLAYICAEDFHRDPTNFRTYMQESYNPDEYYKRLNFDNLISNARSAAWVYDNPGYDTDNDGYAGPYIEVVDTMPSGEITIERHYYAGDGVPDFRAATPPTPPILRHSTAYNSVTIRWNGMITETREDPFTHEVDFEGYRIHMGRLRRADSYALLDSRDTHNYIRYKWDYAREKWIRTENPFTLDSIEVLYGEGFDPEAYPFSYHPVGYHDGQNLWCFKAMDWNRSIHGWDDGSPWKSDIGIHKVYADQIAAGEVTDEVDIEDTLTSNNWLKDIDPLTGDSIWYHKYWEYEYIVDNLLPSVPWHFSVTAFDFGDAVFGVEPLETSPLANSIEAWAIADEHTVREQNLKVRVYPNPYIGDGRYASAGYEDPYQTGYIDHERRIHFLNLPTECNITIFTISGDVVRELNHPGRHSNTPSKLTWNVRSTNNEIVTSGIYLYTVESRRGTQMGKIVIIL